MPESTVLVLVDGAVSKENTMLGVLAPLAAEVAVFPPLKDLTPWIQQRAQRSGVQIDQRAARKLAQLVGRYDTRKRDNAEYLDTWSAAAELEKLSAYKNGDAIGEQDVELLTANLQEQKGYLLCDAIVERRPAAAAKLLSEVLQHDVPQVVLATIAGRFRRLAIARGVLDAGGRGVEIGREVGASGYALERLTEQASRYPLENIRSAYRRIVQADFDHKSGAAEEILALDVLVQELATPPPGRPR
jgi:DNA polymerase III delta subunit